MLKKKYSSYEEIERDLEVLKLEKEIHGRKAALHYERTKGYMSPEYIAKESVFAILPGLKTYSSGIASFLITLILKWIAGRR